MINEQGIASQFDELHTTAAYHPEQFIRSAEQQPEWDEHWLVRGIRADIASMPGLVRWSEVHQLHTLLAEVAAGRMQIIQAGDCAEDPAECVPEVLTRKVALLATLARLMRVRTGQPVLQAGRIAGQFGKPRSQRTELAGGVKVPVFRGLAVNSAEPNAEARRPDPRRLLIGYYAARDAMEFLRRHNDGTSLPVTDRVWTSHEALLLDYELPLLRRADDGRQLLSSMHWPWIGERTRDPYGAHVRLLAPVVNPLACKVGPSTTNAQLLSLCARLDPHRRPGRLTFIARLGAGSVDRLAGMVAVVRAAGHPVIWLCDPMHGNTIVGPCNRKTRLLRDMIAEVTRFRAAVRSAGGVAGGLHLETTPNAVTECVADETALGQLEKAGAYTTLCDPRLNPEQAAEVVSAW